MGKLKIFMLGKLRAVFRKFFLAPVTKLLHESFILELLVLCASGTSASSGAVNSQIRTKVTKESKKSIRPYRGPPLSPL
jgi:hypothetical protein